MPLQIFTVAAHYKSDFHASVLILGNSDVAMESSCSDLHVTRSTVNPVNVLNACPFRVHFRTRFPVRSRDAELLVTAFMVRPAVEGSRGPFLWTFAVAEVDSLGAGDDNLDGEAELTPVVTFRRPLLPTEGLNDAAAAAANALRLSSAEIFLSRVFDIGVGKSGNVTSMRLGTFSLTQYRLGYAMVYVWLNEPSFIKLNEFRKC